MKRLFEVAAEVDAAGKAPPFYAQATVFAIAGADSAEEASAALRRDLERDGYVLVDARIRVDELRLDAWTDHVAQRWTGLASVLPSPEALAGMLESAFVRHVSFYPHE
jgi:hypothetical protein